MHAFFSYVVRYLGYFQFSAVRKKGLVTFSPTSLHTQAWTWTGVVQCVCLVLH